MLNNKTFSECVGYFYVMYNVHQQIVLKSYIIDNLPTIWHCFVCRNFDGNAFDGVLNMTINTLLASTEFSIVRNNISKLIPTWDTSIYTPVL